MGLATILGFVATSASQARTGWLSPSAAWLQSTSTSRLARPTSRLARRERLRGAEMRPARRRAGKRALARSLVLRTRKRHRPAACPVVLRTRERHRAAACPVFHQKTNNTQKRISPNQKHTCTHLLITNINQHSHNFHRRFSY